MTSLEAVAREALNAGWVSMRGDLPVMLEEAKLLGWDAIPIRKGESVFGTLKVVRAEHAHKNSLSAMVGHGSQPLHTDGAHHRLMPDIVMLAAAQPSATPTLLCDPGPPSEAQRAGVFKVGGGSRAFYASAADARGRWRYDPGCMTPMDDQARQASHELDALLERTTEHHWQHPHTILVIANRRVLHARAAATDYQTRRVNRVALNSRLDL